MNLLRIFVLESVGQNADLVAGDFGNQIKYPEDKTNGRDDCQNANDKSGGILGFGVTDDSVNTADDSTQKDLQNDLNDLGQLFIGRGQSLVCHGKILQSDVFFCEDSLTNSISYGVEKIKFFEKKYQAFFKILIKSLHSPTFFTPFLWYNVQKREGSEKMIKNGSQVTYEEKGDTLVVRVGGEIDHHGAVAVRTGIDRRLAADRPARVLLELSSVDFMDRSGLGLIMGRFALVKQYGGTLAVLDPSPAVMKIMKLAGMERMISILRTKTKA